jgi:hypothetical protein
MNDTTTVCSPAATSATGLSLDAPAVAALLERLVADWHTIEPGHAATGLTGKICDLHSFNFQLWHEEDIARSPAVTDQRIAEVKRAIDRYNQLRNDCIEKVDDWLVADLAERGVVAPPPAPAATETPGAAIDRLSILELRRYHMREQIERQDATPEHRDRAAARMAVLDLQRQHLIESTDRLLTEIYSARRPLRVFRQMKMYNDPSMNPYLYKAGTRTAA